MKHAQLFFFKGLLRGVWRAALSWHHCWLRRSSDACATLGAPCVSLGRLRPTRGAPYPGVVVIAERRTHNTYAGLLWLGAVIFPVRVAARMRFCSGGVPFAAECQCLIWGKVQGEMGSAGPGPGDIRVWGWSESSVKPV